ncbi:MAG: PP2C family protein-serine/threonine phosphatase [Jatrophihabitans sp.]|uniref:PP2C family protein-serine/threonine phosphatase n=1 Tax=Jatrophihabitans sp. TaxID=1932789 RepID=UPI00390F106D
MARPNPDFDLFDVLESVEAVSPLEAVDAVTRKLAASLGSDRVCFLIADLAGRALVRLGPRSAAWAQAQLTGVDPAEIVPFSDKVAWAVVVDQQPVTVPDGDGWRVLAPVTQRGEVVGALEVHLPSEPDEAVVKRVCRAAHLLAFVVIANRRHTDLFEWGQRTTPFELSAEMQRRLLPGAFTCEAGSATVAGWLEPAATIGGDTFDYSLGRDTLHVSLTDAMGHGVAAALTATLCVGSLRNTRRAGGSLLEQAAAADAAVRDHAMGAFVTGLLGRLDLGRGVLGLVNAGHVLPVLMRGSVIEPVDLPANLPFGLNANRSYQQTDVPLQVGDRLVLITDGMVDRQAAAVPLTDLLGRTRGLHPREATRQLADAVIEAAGPVLADDATILMLDWHGHHGRDRDSEAGADHPRR